ncbi:hydroxyethylthiazole kinase [Microbacterium halotolerans]|uniref:hydroxyethylthiazole kinase n=1 Tax=Microbacterium halotolerans TaxID=246613 RepID=UPI000E6AB610|nr:hydroxyethylthiazole kinase [Microbacterium halotolerans]
MTRTHIDIVHSSGALLSKLRAEGPLVQCLTNTVTTNLVANAVLAVGGSPAMVDIPEEAGSLARSAGAVLINMGTPSAEQREAMVEAAKGASESATPWVLDPVGIGALPVRTALARELAAMKPTIVRGNASEIRALAGAGAGARGVDATDPVDDARDAAIEIARSCGVVVAVSGEVDLITDGTTVVRIANGTKLFTRITGAGCALGGVIAAFAAISDDQLEATVAACLIYAVVGEQAAEFAGQPGSFAVALLDALDSIDMAMLRERARLS